MEHTGTTVSATTPKKSATPNAFPHFQPETRQEAADAIRHIRKCTLSGVKQTLTLKQAASLIALTNDADGRPILSLNQTARLMREAAPRVYESFRPYFDPMLSMDTAHENYGCDTGLYVVLYALGNWAGARGALASICRAMLNAHAKYVDGKVVA